MLEYGSSSSAFFANEPFGSGIPRTEMLKDRGCLPEFHEERLPLAGRKQGRRRPLAKE
jgi:hypothetical protein